MGWRSKSGSTFTSTLEIDGDLADAMPDCRDFRPPTQDSCPRHEMEGLDRCPVRAALGRQLWSCARGEDERPVDPVREAKSASSEITLDEDVAGLEQLRLVLWQLAETVARRMRKAGVRPRHHTEAKDRELPHHHPEPASQTRHAVGRGDVPDCRAPPNARDRHPRLSPDWHRRPRPRRGPGRPGRRVRCGCARYQERQDDGCGTGEVRRRRRCQGPQPLRSSRCTQFTSQAEVCNRAVHGPLRCGPRSAARRTSRP